MSIRFHHHPAHPPSPGSGLSRPIRHHGHGNLNLFLRPPPATRSIGTININNTMPFLPRPGPHHAAWFHPLQSLSRCLNLAHHASVLALDPPPLTDWCHLTLKQALETQLGGAPFGPADTGKLESVKALGFQFGIFVLVLCCDATFDFQAMGRFFVGLPSWRMGLFRQSIRGEDSQRRQ
jgi:hypothetical protein